MPLMAAGEWGTGLPHDGPLSWPQSQPGVSLLSQYGGGIPGRVLHSALLHSQGVAQFSTGLLYQNIQLSGLEGKVLLL